MPYIAQDRRAALDGVEVGRAANPGELNYQFTRLVRLYLNAHGVSYQTINDVLGALTGARMEFYRRIAAPYEDTKIQQNGDCY